MLCARYNLAMGTEVTTHASLLARLADGSDHSAWGDFQERYEELIRRFAAGRGLQPADCDDVAQTVLLNLMRAMPGFEYDPAKGSFRGYLKAVTLHAIAKIRRQKGTPPGLTSIGGAGDPGTVDASATAAWEAEWRANHVRRALRLLEVEFKAAELRAFQRYAVNGENACATAAALQLTVNQVYQAKSRITKRLAELIESQVQDEG